MYAQYSDMYNVSMPLDKNSIRTIYQMEIMKIRLNKTYNEIWQIHALSSVLNVPIFSVYPQFGNPNVRKDLHRLILPRRDKTRINPVFILWTSTRHKEMKPEHWTPNHFVPVLPIDNVVNEVITIVDSNINNEIEGVASEKKNQNGR